MYFRFGGALLLVLAISLAGVVLEKQILALKRASTHQSFRLDVLRERRAALQLRTEQLGAPPRLLKEIEDGRIPLSKWRRRSPTEQSSRSAQREDSDTGPFH